MSSNARWITMPNVIEKKSGHLLVEQDDGSVDLINLSPFNRLLYENELFGLLKDQDESLTLSDDSHTVHIEPLGDHSYRVNIKDALETELKPHEKSHLIDALTDAFDRDGDPAPKPVVSQVMSLRDYDVLPKDVDPAAKADSFADAVEVTHEGWLIHDSLLLTYNNEFVNRQTDSHKRSGDGVRSTEQAGAYDVRFESQTTIEQYDADHRAARFVARAKWAVDNVSS